MSLVEPTDHVAESLSWRESGHVTNRSAKSLGLALDHLEADIELCDAVGAGVVANFMANKRREVERFEQRGESITGDELTAFEIENYLPYH